LRQRTYCAALEACDGEAELAQHRL